MDDSPLSALAVVLCRAEGSMNVGAVCRAMKTMGLSRLVLADCAALDETTVRTHALAAMDVYERAARFPSLAEALEGFPLAAGFTRRVGRRRKESVPLAAFAEATAARPGSPVALVFGNERDGLSDAELLLCDEAVSIDSSEDFPSLNLSHAVQLAAWELREAFAAASGAAPGEARPAERAPASRAALAGAASAIADALCGAGFYKLAGRPEAESFLREVAARAALSDGELERYKALFVKLAALEKSRAGRGGPA